MYTAPYLTSNIFGAIPDMCLSMIGDGLRFMTPLFFAVLAVIFIFKFSLKILGLIAGVLAGLIFLKTCHPEISGRPGFYFLTRIMLLIAVMGICFLTGILKKYR